MPVVPRSEGRIHVVRDHSPTYARYHERAREWEIPSRSAYVETGSDDEERKRELVERETRRSARHRVISPSPSPSPPPSWRRTAGPMPPNPNTTSTYPGYNRTYIQHSAPVLQHARHHQNQPAYAGPLNPPPVIADHPFHIHSRNREQELRSRIDELDRARQYGDWDNENAWRERSQTHYRMSAADERRGLFQTVYDVADSKDVTVHLNFPVFRDDDAEIEEFSRLRRLGNFEAAKALFQKFFEGQLKNPYMFVQYAEMLLDMGDYKSFALLDPTPAFGADLSTLQRERRESVHHQPQYIYSQPQPPVHHDNFFARTESRPIGRSYHRNPIVPGRSRSFERPSNRETTKDSTTMHRVVSDDSRHQQRSTSSPSPSPPPLHSVNQQPEPERGTFPMSWRETREILVLDETQLLAMNWRLLKAYSIIHHDGTINDGLDEAHFTRKVLAMKPNAGSTEIQIMSLALRIFGYIRVVLPDIYRREIRGTLNLWTDWPELYRQLLTQGRVWDFRDVFSAAVSAFGLKRASLNFFGRDSLREKVIHSWTAHGEDESTILAQLDILVIIILDVQPPEADLNEIELAQLKEDAQNLAESIMKNYPESMKSRPFMRWLMAKSAESSFKLEDTHEDESNPSRAASRKQFSYLHSYLGFPFFPPGWISLPIYVPFDWEHPNWNVPKISDEVNGPVRMTLALAAQLNDHITQALCLKLLILTSQDPADLFDQLGQLQKSVQEDRAEYLLTCLSKYLVCRNKASQSQLLAELREMDDWSEPWIMRDAHACFAKQYIERVLSARVKGRKFLPLLDRASMPYLTWLSSTARRFIGVGNGIDLKDTPQTNPARSRSFDEDELDIAIRERDVRRQPPRAQPSYAEDVVMTERGRHWLPSSKNQDGNTNEFTSSIKEPGGLVTARVSGETRHDAPPPPSKDKSRKSTRFVEGRTITSAELSPESSSDHDADSEDFRQIFGHLSKGLMRRELLAGKRITVSVQDSEKADEHGSVSWVKDGEWIYTTKKERIVDEGAEPSEHARHLREKRRARRRRAAESNGESTDSTKSGSDVGGNLRRKEAARFEPENLELALIRHPDPTNEGIRIIP